MATPTEDEMSETTQEPCPTCDRDLWHPDHVCYTYAELEEWRAPVDGEPSTLDREHMDAAVDEGMRLLGLDKPLPPIIGAALANLVHERDEARAALDRVRDVHASSLVARGVIRFDQRMAMSTPYCEGCGENWPCPTIRAIDGPQPE